MRILRFLICLLILGCLLLPIKVEAASSDVTITATGFICGTPVGLTLTYVSDWEVDISWVAGIGAVNTMIRAAYGHAPTSITDGYMLYSGPGVSVIDNIASLAAPDILYYSAFSQNAGGVWTALYASADTGGFMSVSYLFIGLILLACFLTYMSWKSPNILIAFAAGLMWLAMAFWIVLGNITNLPLTSPWTQFMAWVFTLMTFVPFILQWNVEIKQSKNGQSWSSWGQPPNPGMSNFEAYQKELRRRLRTTQRRAGL